MKILEGVAFCVVIGRQMTVDDKNAFFCHFGAYNFGAFIAEAKITIRRHEVVYRLSSERKIIDLE